MGGRALSGRIRLLVADTWPTWKLTTDSPQAAAGQRIRARQRRPELAGMGTTLCPSRWCRCRPGVSSAWHQRQVTHGPPAEGRLLEQVTDDHSLVASLERQGRLTREEAAVHPQRNIITRALGIDARVMVDSWEVVPIPGDRYVLCSDGLFNEVDEVIAKAVAKSKEDRYERPTEFALELKQAVATTSAWSSSTCSTMTTSPPTRRRAPSGWSKRCRVRPAWPRASRSTSAKARASAPT
jgi:hypothetical protein